MNLLALDQSSHITGYQIFHDDKLYKYGKFEVNEQDIGERLWAIRTKVLTLIHEQHIDRVVFEDIQLQNNVVNNVKTFKILAEVFGVIEEALVENKIPYDVVLASVWKSTLDIKGKDRPAQKRAAQQYVVDTYDVKPTQDECDAICIGKHWLSINGSMPQDFNWDDG